MKKLYRSEENKIFTGVIGGLGEYFGVDPVALRALWILITVFTGVIPGVVVYLLATIVIPKRHGGHNNHHHEHEHHCKCEKKHKHHHEHKH
ncbi:PspC domain-containing protein [Patescibacteria group bacterium]